MLRRISLADRNKNWRALFLLSLTKVHAIAFILSTRRYENVVIKYGTTSLLLRVCVCIDALSIRKRRFRWEIILMRFHRRILAPDWAGECGKSRCKIDRGKIRVGVGSLRCYLAAKRGDLWAYCVSSMEIFEARKQSGRDVYHWWANRGRKMTPEKSQRHTADECAKSVGNKTFISCRPARQAERAPRIMRNHAMTQLKGYKLAQNPSNPYTYPSAYIRALIFKPRSEKWFLHGEN